MQMPSVFLLSALCLRFITRQILSSMETQIRITAFQCSVLECAELEVQSLYVIHVNSQMKKRQHGVKQTSEQCASVRDGSICRVLDINSTRITKAEKTCHSVKPLTTMCKQ